MNKKVPLWVLLLTVWIGFVGILLFGWAVGYVHEGGYLIRGKAKDAVLAIARFPTLVNASIKQIFSPPPLILNDRYPNINKLKLREKSQVDSNYLLMSVYDAKADQSSIKLLRLSDQNILHRWVPSIKAIIDIRDKGRPLSESSNKGNIVFWHPLLLNDGSIVFNTEDRALIKMDRSGTIVWSVEGKYHHSQELDTEGNIWASSVMDKNPEFISRLFEDYRDDALAKISPEGKLLNKLSISQILWDNGYRGLLFGIGPAEADPLHLNDIQPALSSGKYWEKGDLLVSIRNKSTVFLYRPSTNKVLWLKTGPWLNQHDADFIDDHRISIFGNNIVRNRNYDFIDGHNEVYIYDFETDEISTPYTEVLKRSQVKTMTGGRSEILPNGDLFVEETDFGRMLLLSPEIVKWEYVERLGERTSSILGWTRILSKDKISQLKL